MSIDWIHLILLGALAGTLGQTARVVIGIKKLQDEAATRNQATPELFVTSRLVVSLMIGAAAGGLCAIGAAEPGAAVATQQLLAFAAAGYSGTDFIEGLMSRALPAKGTIGATSAPAPVSSSTAEHPV